MSTTRRGFLRTTAAAGAAMGAGLLSLSLGDLVPPQGIARAASPLRILILGGTGFIGPNQVRYAVARGHKVTLFNRSKTNPGLFKGVPNVEERLGDRAPNPGNYDSLKTGEWDVVIDNPTTRPRWAREATAAINGRAKQYVFISTLSVYAENDTPGADETAAVATTDTPAVEEGPSFARLYGPLKALSEQEVQKAFLDRSTIIRPGLIVGVGDASDRFTYWPVRLAKGGEVLAPPADDPVQFIDARDLGEWTIRCCENQTYGVYNATGPATQFFVRGMLEGIQSTINSHASLVYTTTEFLDAQKVRGWSELPVWLPTVGRTAGFTRRSIARALAKGLTFRPYAETVRDTLEFYRSQTSERQETLRSGIKPEREAAVLAAWHALK